MVYDSIRGQVAYVLRHIRMVESAHRTDGLFPLYERMKTLLLNLDKQSLAISTYKHYYSPVFAINYEYYTIYYLHNGTDAFIIAITIEDNGTKYNLRTNQNITTQVHYSDIPRSYKSYPNGGTFESRNFEFVYRVHNSKRQKTYNIFDHSTGKMLFDVDFDELIPISVYSDGEYGKGYYYGDMGWYKLYDNGYYEYMDSPEINESLKKHTITLTESDLRIIINQCIRRVMEEQKRYVDSKHFGWKYLEKNRRNAGATDYDIEQLRKAYDEYGRECAAMGKLPNDTGFSIWCTEKDIESCKAGNGIRYPNYFG